MFHLYSVLDLLCVYIYIFFVSFTIVCHALVSNDFYDEVVINEISKVMFAMF